jgi:hypothetical protein
VEAEEHKERHALGKGVSGFFPRVNADGSIASARPAPEAREPEGGGGGTDDDRKLKQLAE